MYDAEQHLEDLIAHVERVRANALLLAKHWIKNGRSKDARVLLAKAHVHDASKWAGIEFEMMHRGPDANGQKLLDAIAQHQSTNDHHPEFWGGLSRMPEVCVAEMVCDWLARSQEFATDLRVYVRTQAAERYNFLYEGSKDRVRWIWEFIDILLPEKFTKG